MALIDDVEFLAVRLNALREAEELALLAQPHMVPELRKLYTTTLSSLYEKAKRILRGRVSLSGAPPKIPMEVLERLFATLRDQAEIEWTRSLKLTGAHAKRARIEADRFARLAHDAAVSIKIASEARGIWNQKYASEHGVDAWL